MVSLVKDTSPGWVNTQAILENKDVTVECSVTDQMYKLAISFVSSLNDMWQSYYIVGGNQDDISKSDGDDIRVDTEQSNNGTSGTNK